MEKEAKLFHDYLIMTPGELKSRLRGLTEEVINASLEKKVIENFKTAAKSVPAYKDFLSKNNVNPDKINTLDDFAQVPLIDKKNYLSQYPLEDLVIGGDLGNTTVITMSSGSTGEPFFWPRVIEQDIGMLQGVESSFLESFNIDKKKTLHLTSLGMGVWMAGDIMSMTGRYFAQKGYNLTVMHPGVDVETNLKIIKNIGSEFDQVIISCYPPLAKDIVDEASHYGIDWNKINLKLFVGGEPFVEQWRDYIFKKIKGKNKYKDIVSCLGSSEGGVAGVETPLTILIRQKCKKSPSLTKRLFKDTRIPSLIQYNPLAKYFESVDDQLILTCMNGLPLIRYNTKDAGNTIPFSHFYKQLNDLKLEPEKEIKKEKGEIFWKFPFLYLFGRSDLTATIYGVNIYPENIRSSLLDRKVMNIITSKFILKTIYDEEGNQYLLIKVQLKSNIKNTKTIKNLIKHLIVRNLIKDNSEYKKLHQAMGKRVEPQIEIKDFDSREFETKNKLKIIT